MAETDYPRVQYKNGGLYQICQYITKLLPAWTIPGTQFSLEAS